MIGTYWYHGEMATNLRLRSEVELALRAEAERTGRSQQDLIREAIEVALGLRADDRRDRERAELLASRGILTARLSFRELAEADLTRLPKGTSSDDLLDREDRL